MALPIGDLFIVLPIGDLFMVLPIGDLFIVLPIGDLLDFLGLPMVLPIGDLLIDSWMRRTERWLLGCTATPKAMGFLACRVA